MMARNMVGSLLVAVLSVVVLVAGSARGHPWGGGGFPLIPQFYDHSCPQAKHIVKSIVTTAVAREARMAASLLRLLFHDCFVQVCKRLDSSSSFLYRHHYFLSRLCTSE
jgi:peroxidase